MTELYIYGYLNRAQSSRRLSREIGRTVEGDVADRTARPDHKTIADFCKDNSRHPQCLRSSHSFRG